MFAAADPSDLDISVPSRRPEPPPRRGPGVTFLTMSQVSRLVKVSHQAVQHAIKSGRIPSVDVLGVVMIPAEAALAWRQERNEKDVLDELRPDVDA